MFDQVHVRDIQRNDLQLADFFLEILFLFRHNGHTD